MSRRTLPKTSEGNRTSPFTPAPKDLEETSLPDSREGRAALHCLRMANWFMKTRTWNDTIVWLNQAIKIQPEFFEAHFLFGEVHLELGQFEKAIESYRKAIQLRPSDPTPQVKLGYAYIALNDWTSAQRQYQALRQLNEVIANELFDKIVYSFNYGMFESLFTHMQEAK